MTLIIVSIIYGVIAIPAACFAMYCLVKEPVVMVNSWGDPAKPWKKPG
jgi:hypothetical protein